MNDELHETDLEQESKQELAVDRTDWAKVRTLLAKERSYTAWIRTGLAALAAGLGIAHLLKAYEPQWIVILLGFGLGVAGLMAPVLGFWSYRKSLKQLEEQGIRGVSLQVIGIFTSIVIIASLFALILIFIR